MYTEPFQILTIWLRRETDPEIDREMFGFGFVFCSFFFEPTETDRLFRENLTEPLSTRRFITL